MPPCRLSLPSFSISVFMSRTFLSLLTFPTVEPWISPAIISTLEWLQCLKRRSCLLLLLICWLDDGVIGLDFQRVCVNSNQLNQRVIQLMMVLVNMIEFVPRLCSLHGLIIQGLMIHSLSLSRSLFLSFSPSEWKFTNKAPINRVTAASV